MRLLVTGALGFVGINLVRYLAGTLPDAAIVAADLVPCDALATAFLAPVARQVRHLELDVTDRVALVRAVEGHAITHILHAAAITPGSERERRAPTQIVDVNLLGAINVLEATATVPCVERTLLLSSSGVYGAPAMAPSALQPEDGPLQLDNLYSITKRSAELLGARYAELCGKPILSARLAAPFGPLERPSGSRAQMGQLQGLLAALRSGRRVRVAGPDVERDWTYVDDTAEAIRGLLSVAQPAHAVYNVSSGVAVRFDAVVAAFAARGLQAEWVADPADAEIAMRPHQRRAALDLARLQTETGFAPRYTLERGIAAYLAAEAELAAVA